MHRNLSFFQSHSGSHQIVLIQQCLTPAITLVRKVVKFSRVECVPLSGDSILLPCWCTPYHIHASSEIRTQFFSILRPKVPDTFLKVTDTYVQHTCPKVPDNFVSHTFPKVPDNCVSDTFPKIPDTFVSDTFPKVLKGGK